MQRKKTNRNRRAPLPHLPTSHRWHHLLGTNPPLLIVMERLHSGGRKFAVLDSQGSVDERGRFGEPGYCRGSEQRRRQQQ